MSAGIVTAKPCNRCGHPERAKGQTFCIQCVRQSHQESRDRLSNTACPSCGLNRPDGICRPCRNAKTAQWKKDNPVRHRQLIEAQSARARGLWQQHRGLRKYGLTLDDYDSLLISQGGTCATCPTRPEENPRGRLFVDHDHTTGVVRGLLCSRCNLALGYVKDDVNILRSLINYLQEI